MEVSESANDNRPPSHPWNTFNNHLESKYRDWYEAPGSQLSHDYYTLNCVSPTK